MIDFTWDINGWSLIGVLIALWGVINASQKASADQIKAIEKESDQKIESSKAYLVGKLDEHREKTGLSFSKQGERIQALEAKGISHDDLNRLHEKIREVETKISTVNSGLVQSIGEMKGELKAITSSLDRLQDYLIQQGNKPHG
jgi:tetrahydromethanopterin S-methyltransferase subunit G